MSEFFKEMLKDESGQDMVEYTILTGMIVVAVIASITTVAGWVQTQWSNLAAAL